MNHYKCSALDVSLKSALKDLTAVREGLHEAYLRHKETVLLRDDDTDPRNTDIEGLVGELAAAENFLKAVIGVTEAPHAVKRQKGWYIPPTLFDYFAAKRDANFVYNNFPTKSLEHLCDSIMFAVQYAQAPRQLIFWEAIHSISSSDRSVADYIAQRPIDAIKCVIQKYGCLKVEFEYACKTNGMYVGMIAKIPKLEPVTV